MKYNGTIIEKGLIAAMFSNDSGDKINYFIDFSIRDFTLLPSYHNKKEGSYIYGWLFFSFGKVII